MKILIFILLYLSSFLQAQGGFEVLHHRFAKIKFKQVSNLIIIPVTINGTQLNFLLDSGVTHTILFSLENKEITFNKVEKIIVRGLGEGEEMQAWKSYNNQISIGENLIDRQHTIYIILSEAINISKHLGIPINGIIGYDFFKNHPVEINFLSQKIKVYKNYKKVKRRLKRYESFPITIEMKKPYMHADVSLNTRWQSAKLLIDLGNGDGLWLFPDIAKDYTATHPSINDFLGSGFSGAIYGKRARIGKVSFGSFSFKEPLAAFPNAKSLQYLQMAKDRKGSIGNEIWRRFKLILIYPKNKIYLKKNRHYHDPFLYNKSGLIVQQDGFHWQKDYVAIHSKEQPRQRGVEVWNNKSNLLLQYKYVLKPHFSVANCRPHSPCSEAKLQKGDKILEINRREADNFTLQEIRDLLKKGKEGEQIKFKVKRGEAILLLSLTLKDPIPFLSTD